MRESAYFFKESQNAAFIGSYKADFTADHWDSSEVLDQIFGIDKNYHRSVKGWLDLVHPDDKAMMNDHLLTDIFKHRNPFNKEYRIVRIADGEIRWVHGLGEVSFDNAGHPLLLIGTIQDITERHLAETKLIQSEKKYKLLAENTKDVIWVLDPERVKLIYVSPSVEHLLGYTPDEVLNIPFEMILTPELRPVFVERYKKKVAEFAANPLPGAGSKNEVIHVRKDGTLVVTEIVINFYMNEDNGKVEIQGVSRDITEQKRAENALKFNEERAKKNNALLRSIFESSHGIIIFSLDLEFRYTAFTFSHRETMKAIWGVDIELGMHMPSLINRQDDRNSALANFKRAMQGDHFIQMEVYGEEPFRRILWENRYSPIYSDEHKVVGLTVFVTDITERRKAEETIKANEARLKELNATKDKFFSIIAHDLKSPFNAIIGFSNLLVEQMQEKDYVGIEEYASIIKESSLRAMSLLANLLEWSRSQTGKMEYNPEYLELVILIGEVTDLLNDVARQKSIIITRKLPHNILVLADKSMISTILRNLVSNAIKFTNPGGTVNIAAKSEESDWVISVQDTGIGIHQDDVNKLFRIDETYSTKGTQNETGTGLGLLLCKEFIEKHQSEILVESEEGKGSTFKFHLPLLNKVNEYGSSFN